AAREGLAAFQPAPQRLSPLAAAGVHLLDDTYNANADSMAAALQTLADLPCEGRRVAVLGDMAELGADTEAAHAEVGRLAARLEIDSVLTVGRHGPATAAAAGSGRGRAYATLGEATAAVVHSVEPGDAVLVKASRSSRLERVVAAMMKQLELREMARMPGAG
ncbi:MAG: UDP-N-acetylmuramoyl-tripeptide--D-alanyl-D-alanine ligase, partial [Verrucomicrobia bacterium]|nr:UDP-N-acetylmuramoyl-tripeptide--D-alanyl-D-alanine ligase [Verrucomicrobiota bacterium]